MGQVVVASWVALMQGQVSMEVAVGMTRAGVCESGGGSGDGGGRR